MNKILDIMRSDFVPCVSLLKAAVGGDGLQVARQNADDLQPDLRVLLPPCCDLNVGNSKQFYISQCCYFERLYRLSCPLTKV